MIPILYEASETSFTTNGIGRLTDCVMCEVTEERNGQYECKFKYPIDGQHYDDITEGKIIYCLHDESGEPQPFDIYSHSAPSNGIVTFYARHISYRLSNVIVRPFTAGSATLALNAVKTNSINTNPFTFWTDISSSGSVSIDVPMNAKSVLGGVEGSILDVFHGEYMWDKFTVRLYASRGEDNGVSIRYGHNIVEATEEIDIGDSYNAIVPYWVDPETHSVITVNDDIVSKASEVGQALRPVAMDMSSEFDTQPTNAQLSTRALKYLNDNRPWEPNENITIDFEQLWQTKEYEDVASMQRLRLCDVAHVYYPDLNIDASKKVIKTVYDALTERYTRMELGKSIASYAQVVRGSLQGDIDKVREAMVTPGMMTQAIYSATQQITGANGGYIREIYDASGNFIELIIMDSPNINQAQKVWRWNSNGLGYSRTGYNGTYSLAITKNGAIVADFITTGSLSANLIQTGTITDSSGRNYWNLNTGTIRMTQGSISIGNFSVSSSGYLSCTGADISGDFKTSVSLPYGTVTTDFSEGIISCYMGSTRIYTIDATTTDLSNNPILDISAHNNADVQIGNHNGAWIWLAHDDWMGITATNISINNYSTYTGTFNTGNGDLVTVVNGFITDVS